jgi:hypothetical protein
MVLGALVIYTLSNPMLPFRAMLAPYFNYSSNDGLNQQEYETVGSRRQVRGKYCNGYLFISLFANVLVAEYLLFICLL